MLKVHQSPGQFFIRVLAFFVFTIDIKVDFKIDQFCVHLSTSISEIKLTKWHQVSNQLIKLLGTLKACFLKYFLECYFFHE